VIVVHRRANSRSGIGVVSILSVVEYVERLSPELEGNPLRKLEVLADPHIPVVDTRSAQDVASAATELARQRLNEACSVEKFVNALVKSTVRVATGDQVSPLGKGCEKTETVVG
jgi:hypothetical protein